MEYEFKEVYKERNCYLIEPSVPSSVSIGYSDEVEDEKYTNSIATQMLKRSCTSSRNCCMLFCYSHITLKTLIP
jgi:hypothetical protein